LFAIRKMKKLNIIIFLFVLLLASKGFTQSQNTENNKSINPRAHSYLDKERAFHYKYYSKQQPNTQLSQGYSAVPIDRRKAKDCESIKNPLQDVQDCEEYQPSRLLKNSNNARKQKFFQYYQKSKIYAGELPPDTGQSPSYFENYFSSNRFTHRDHNQK